MHTAKHSIKKQQQEKNSINVAQHCKQSKHVAQPVVSFLSLVNIEVVSGTAREDSFDENGLVYEFVGCIVEKV